MCKTAVDSLRLSILYPLRLLRLKPIFLKNYPVSFKSQILIMTISYNLMMSFGPRENFFFNNLRNGSRWRFKALGEW